MLRVFSSIRQSLLSENRTVQYLKYAVGEIVLIVVGILIALQISNWNEERKLDRQREELIENLKGDFQNNLERLEETLTRISEKHDNLLLVQQASVGENDDLSVPEIKALLRDFYTGGYRFEAALGAYKSALSTGSIGLIRDATLNELFIAFEDANVRFQSMAEVSRLDRLTGGTFEIRKQLGSFNILTATSDFTPQRFALSDDAFLEFLGDREVYGILEARRETVSRMIIISNQMKDIAEDILTGLENH